MTDKQLNNNEKESWKSLNPSIPKIQENKLLVIYESIIVNFNVFESAL
jgi:hypothetical protein